MRRHLAPLVLATLCFLNGSLLLAAEPLRIATFNVPATPPIGPSVFSMRTPGPFPALAVLKIWPCPPPHRYNGEKISRVTSDENLHAGHLRRVVVSRGRARIPRPAG